MRRPLDVESLVLCERLVNLFVIMAAGKKKQSAKWQVKNISRAVLHCAESIHVAETDQGPWDVVATTSFSAKSVGKKIVDQHGVPEHDEAREHWIAEQSNVFENALRQRLIFSMKAADSAAERHGNKRDRSHHTSLEDEQRTSPERGRERHRERADEKSTSPECGRERHRGRAHQPIFYTWPAESVASASSKWVPWRACSRPGDVLGRQCHRQGDHRHKAHRMR